MSALGAAGTFVDTDIDQQVKVMWRVVVFVVQLAVCVPIFVAHYHRLFA